MQHDKGKKKTTRHLGLSDPSVQRQIEADFERVTKAIKEKMDLVKMFEDLIEKRITAGYCPGCEHFENCTPIRIQHRYDDDFCWLDGDKRDELKAIFSKGISVVEDVAPATETFSGN